MKLWTLKHLLSIQFNTDIIWQFECESKNSTVRLVALGMLPSTLLLHFSRENGAQHLQRQVPQAAWQKAYMGTGSRVGPCQDAEVWYWWEGSPHIPAATRVSHLLDKAWWQLPTMFQERPGPLWGQSSGPEPFRQEASQRTACLDCEEFNKNCSKQRIKVCSTFSGHIKHMDKSQHIQ